MIVVIVAPQEPVLLDVQGAAEATSISGSKLRELAARHEVPHKHVGTRLLFPSDELREWAKEH